MPIFCILQICDIADEEFFNEVSRTIKRDGDFTDKYGWFAACTIDRLRILLTKSVTKTIEVFLEKLDEKRVQPPQESGVQIAPTREESLADIDSCRNDFMNLPRHILYTRYCNIPDEIADAEELEAERNFVNISMLQGSLKRKIRHRSRKGHKKSKKGKRAAKKQKIDKRDKASASGDQTMVGVQADAPVQTVALEDVEAFAFFDGDEMEYSSEESSDNDADSDEEDDDNADPLSNGEEENDIDDLDKDDDIEEEDENEENRSVSADEAGSGSNDDNSTSSNDKEDDNINDESDENLDSDSESNDSQASNHGRGFSRLPRNDTIRQTYHANTSSRGNQQSTFSQSQQRAESSSSASASSNPEDHAFYSV